MGEFSQRAVAVGVSAYASLFLFYGVYSLVKGASSPLWFFLEVAIAIAIGSFGFWRLSRGASVLLTAMIVALVHVGVRLAVPLLEAIGDPEVPGVLVAIMFITGLIVTSGWFLISRLVASLVMRSE